MRKLLVPVVLALTLLSPLAQARRVAGTDLPETVHVGGRALQLNGAALQKVMWLKVYVAALYLESPTRSADVAIGSNQAKSVRLTLLRNLSQKQAQKALEDGFRDAAGDQADALEPRLARLLAAVRSLEKGDNLVLSYVPGIGTQLIDKGQKRLTIPGKDFADALFSIWLGPASSTPNIKRGLLGQG